MMITLNISMKTLNPLDVAVQTTSSIPMLMPMPDFQIMSTEDLHYQPLAKILLHNFQTMVPLFSMILNVRLKIGTLLWLFRTMKIRLGIYLAIPKNMQFMLIPLKVYTSNADVA